MRRKKLISIAAALIMAVSAVPSFAAGTGDAAAVKAAASGTGMYAPGTYSVTANLVVPGKYNTVLVNVDAYATNPDNPSGTVDAADPNCTNVYANAPTMGLENNARLTVAQDGGMTLSLNLPNPVFTIQEIGGCSTASVVSSSTVQGSYGLKTSRISHIDVKLDYTDVTTWTDKVIAGVDTASNAHTSKEKEMTGRIYTFSTCKEHPAILFQDWDVPLELRVDFSGVTQGTGTSTTGTQTFTDVNTGDYYYEPVYWALENGITTGTSATAFSPSALCTRAQIITFLWRASGSPEPAGTSKGFGDVSTGAYYYKACCWALENGIADGTAFQPDAACTRAMAVEFMWKQSGSPSYQSSTAFTDVSGSASYAEAVAWALDKGVTTGTSSTAFSPESTCTRAQIVTFLSRYLG